jgi:hypothetical protein
VQKWDYFSFGFPAMLGDYNMKVSVYLLGRLAALLSS